MVSLDTSEEKIENLVEVFAFWADVADAKALREELLKQVPPSETEQEEQSKPDRLGETFRRFFMTATRRVF
jgi:hypothetical protein